MDEQDLAKRREGGFMQITDINLPSTITPTVSSIRRSSGSETGSAGELEPQQGLLKSMDRSMMRRGLGVRSF